MTPLLSGIASGDSQCKNSGLKAQETLQVYFTGLSQPRTQFPLDYANKDTVTELTNQVFYTFESLNKEFIASMHSVGIILNFLISNV